MIMIEKTIPRPTDTNAEIAFLLGETVRLNGEAGLRGYEMSDLHPDFHIMAAQDTAFPAGPADIQSSAHSPIDDNVRY